MAASFTINKSTECLISVCKACDESRKENEANFGIKGEVNRQYLKVA
jgi:predicted metal-binding protein